MLRLTMALSDTRLAAQSAFVARRLVADGVVRTASVADLRRALEAALAFDRDRERELDVEVTKLLQKNAQAIKAAGADHGEMFRKAKKLLAADKKIPL
jgi:hypothetical protein